ncbi:hypothetical protein SADUNF_Sadunf12G0100700 [Salix dunnii]|uniref:Uncharacterized protein n=1 Tax=Salix dunnii TaxID=1413687 RepID=A0A835JM38_9ROSI|nr:hypothetical protein SADUNF_Sadunf12G0100700 [Salix dunnii]
MIFCDHSSQSTVELIIQAASNSLVIFCFCNLIIVMILMGSKPVSNFGQESGIPRSMVTKTRTTVREDIPAKPSLDGNKKPSLDESTDDRKHIQPWLPLDFNREQITFAQINLHWQNSERMRANHKLKERLGAPSFSSH